MENYKVLCQVTRGVAVRCDLFDALPTHDTTTFPSFVFVRWVKVHLETCSKPSTFRVVEWWRSRRFVSAGSRSVQLLRDIDKDLP